MPGPRSHLPRPAGRFHRRRRRFSLPRPRTSPAARAAWWSPTTPESPRRHGSSAITARGWPKQLAGRELVNVVGMNFRLTELQAAVAIAAVAAASTSETPSRRDNTFVPSGADASGSRSCAPDRRSRRRRRVLHLEVALPAAPRRPRPGNPRAAMRDEGIPLVAGYARLLHELPTYARRIAFVRAGAPFVPPYHDGARCYGAWRMPSLGSNQRAIPLVCFRTPAQRPARHGRRRQGVRKGPARMRLGAKVE